MGQQACLGGPARTPPKRPAMSSLSESPPGSPPKGSTPLLSRVARYPIRQANSVERGGLDNAFGFNRACSDFLPDTASQALVVAAVPARELVHTVKQILALVD